jgi:hypothetical protein
VLDTRVRRNRGEKPRLMPIHQANQACRCGLSPACAASQVLPAPRPVHGPTPRLILPIPTGGDLERERRMSVFKDIVSALKVTMTHSLPPNVTLPVER